MIVFESFSLVRQQQSPYDLCRRHGTFAVLELLHEEAVAASFHERQDSVRIAQRLKQIRLDTDYYLCPWDKEQGKKTSEMLLRALHEMTDTKFSTDYFLWAWNKFEKELP